MKGLLDSEALMCGAGLAGSEGLTPEALLGSDSNRDVLVNAGLWKQSYWYRLKQRMQPPHMEGDDPNACMLCCS